MTLTSIADIKEISFAANARPSDLAMVVTMSGNADTVIYERLKSLLDQLQSTARAQAMKEVVFDVRDLYFMNSSCLSLFLRFINGVLELQTTQRYRVRFRSNPNLRWQKKSLQAVASYATEVVVLE